MKNSPFSSNLKQKCEKAFSFTHDSLSVLKNSSRIILEFSWVPLLKNGPSEHSEVLDPQDPPFFNLDTREKSGIVLEFFFTL